jgi:hypothetical protein
MSPQPPRPEPHISVVVKSTAGTWPDARFNRNNRAQKILDDGVDHFRLDPNPPRPYILRRESSGAQLALDQKLDALGLVDGETVLIQPTQAIDG